MWMDADLALGKEGTRGGRRLGLAIDMPGEVLRALVPGRAKRWKVGATLTNDIRMTIFQIKAVNDMQGTERILT